MILEMDEVAVNKGLWERVSAGDVEARAKLREKLHGLVLYFHVLHLSADEVIVTLRQLEDANILECVKLNCERVE